MGCLLPNRSWTYKGTNTDFHFAQVGEEKERKSVVCL